MIPTGQIASRLRENPAITDFAGSNPVVSSPVMPSALGSLRVALVHDWLVNMRGGEKVLELICRRFPDAPLWTLLYARGSVSPTIEDREISTSLLQSLPFARTKYRHYLPLFPLFAELTKVRDFDIVISSSHAVAKGMVKKDRDCRPLHICYIHTPMRYIWDRFDDYFGADKVGALASQLLFRPLARMLQAYDKETVDRVDVFIANSRFVADRVKRLYGREAEVLPPPVDVQCFAAVKRSPEDWYLMVTALAPYKRVDHAIRACASLGRQLRIVGSGPEEKNLKSLARDAGAKVQFMGFVDGADLVEYYRRARGLLCPGVEDFGIVPVEAIATGCPVVAFRQGGVLDSMTDETAHLYSEQTVEGLREAMLSFEGREFSERELRNRAASFAPECFLGRFEQILEGSWNEWRRRHGASFGQ
ncbi:MAG: glycosyltransferase [Candidatus Korobacteraceae bacterium]